MAASRPPFEPESAVPKCRMYEMLYDDRPRPRDPVRERRERERYALLLRIYDLAAGSGDAPISALDAGEAMGLSRENVFRAVQFLAHHDYLDYVAAGPRVRITAKGAGFLTRTAGRRRSIREG